MNEGGLLRAQDSGWEVVVIRENNKKEERRGYQCHGYKEKPRTKSLGDRLKGERDRGSKRGFRKGVKALRRNYFQYLRRGRLAKK